MYKIVVFIPLEHSQRVKQAMFDAGAGKIGCYDSCSFELAGKGQFRPLPGSTPFIGQTDQIEEVEELRVEMVCEASFILPVIAQMKEAHPYEEVAYDVVKLESFWIKILIWQTASIKKGR